MSARGPWPLAIVTGMLGSGKTTTIAHLLRHEAMSDTLVLVNEFGEIGLDHQLIEAVTDNVVLLKNGCLCCMVRSDVVRTLRDLQRAWLAGTIPDFGRVLVETTGLAEPAPLIGAIVAHPLIVDSFALASVSTVVDAQYGLMQIAERSTSRNQICLADHLILAKDDLVDREGLASLENHLRALNPLATLTPRGGIGPDLVFGREASAVPRSGLACDEPPDHLTGISTILLRAPNRLSWTAFQMWLSHLLDRSGAYLLRLKGRLAFDAGPRPVIVQAVHHTFYPIIEASAEADPTAPAFLVLIFDGSVPQEATDHIATFTSLEIGA